MAPFVIAASIPLAGIALWLLLRALRGNMDLVGLHFREAVRHIISWVLMLGTLAGTVWTFSNGQLTLAGWQERIISVGSIAAALEVGCIYTGLAIQQLDLRIKTGKPRDVQEYRSRRRTVVRWFVVMLAISACANFTFRYQQLGAVWPAFLATAAPILLIVVFTIVLQPLHPDYVQMRRHAVQRGLVQLTRSSQDVLAKHLRAMGRGEVLSEKAMQQLAFAAALMRMDAATNEAQALDFAINQGTGATVIDSTAEDYLSSADVERLWAVPRRTAQLWVSTAQGRRKAGKGNAWLAPESAIIAQHGRPSLQLAPPRTRKTSKPRANAVQTPASEPQEGADPAAEPAQSSAIEQ